MRRAMALCATAAAVVLLASLTAACGHGDPFANGPPVPAGHWTPIWTDAGTLDPSHWQRSAPFPVPAGRVRIRLVLSRPPSPMTVFNVDLKRLGPASAMHQGWDVRGSVGGRVYEYTTGPVLAGTFCVVITGPSDAYKLTVFSGTP